MADKKDKKVVAFTGRKAIPKSVRFAVFKRDAFTCQYCGAKAPDVLLQIDHIKPVADGGENEVVNLITSCAACNGGKGAEPLDENAVIEKQRRQLEDLTERRNQLEMMVEWREGLRDLEGEYLQAIQAEFLQYSAFQANETGLRDVRGWLKKFGFEGVVDAIGKSFTQYLETGEDGKVTSESWNKAFHKVPKIAQAEKSFGPAAGRIFYIRGIIRNRFSYGEHLVIDLVQDALENGADIEKIVRLAKSARNWTDFETVIENHIKEWKRENG